MITRLIGRLFQRADQTSAWAELEGSLGYRFQNPSFLHTALSHRSFVNSQKSAVRADSNERLEFLGDSVLNIIVTDYLFHTFPEREEGRMSKMKSLVVSAKVLARCAENLELGNHILLSRSEEKSGGRTRLSILADAYEAVLGAVYLDGGIDAAKRLVHRSLLPILDEVLGDVELVNYKSRLLEYTQSHGLGVPTYEVREESGPEHQKVFVVGVLVREAEWGRGSGLSKKEAEQAGARDALLRRTGVDGPQRDEASGNPED